MNVYLEFFTKCLQNIWNVLQKNVETSRASSIATHHPKMTALEIKVRITYIASDNCIQDILTDK